MIKYSREWWKYNLSEFASLAYHNLKYGNSEFVFKDKLYLTKYSQNTIFMIGHYIDGFDYSYCDIIHSDPCFSDDFKHYKCVGKDIVIGEIYQGCVSIYPRGDHTTHEFVITHYCPKNQSYVAYSPNNRIVCCVNKKGKGSYRALEATMNEYGEVRHNEELYEVQLELPEIEG